MGILEKSLITKNRETCEKGQQKGTKKRKSESEQCGKNVGTEEKRRKMCS